MTSVESIDSTFGIFISVYLGF